MGGGNNHQALADNHPLGFRTIVIRSDNSSSLTRIDSDKKKTKKKQTLSCQWRSEGGGQGGTYVPGRRVEGAPK